MASSAAGLKAEGNRCFALGLLEAALTAYGAAAQALAEDEQDEEDLRCLLHCNSAACLLKLGRFADCIKEATAALAFNPHLIKALFRRAQAYEHCGDLEPALRDLRLALHLEPGNKEVLVAARRVAAAVQVQLTARSPVAQMLDTVRSPLQDKSGNTEERCRRKEAMMGLVGLASQEPQAANDVLREADVLVALLEGGNDAEERLLAFRLLAACCAHPAFVEQAFGPEPTVPLACLMGEEGGEHALDEEDEQLALVKVVVFLRALMALGSAPGETDTRSTVALLVEQALDSWTRALQHEKHMVREAGVDALLWWCSSAGVDCKAFIDDDGQKPRMRMERLLTLLNKSEDAEADETLPSCGALRTKGAQVLGTLLANASEEAAQASIKRAFGRPDVTAEGMLLVMLGAFLANPATGVKAIEQHAEAKRCLQAMVLPSSSTPTAEALAAEFINVAASSEQGRACLATLLEDAPQALHVLMASSYPRARIAAASAFTKLGLAAKALTCSPSELQGLLSIAVGELQRGADPASIDRALEVLCCLVTKTAFKDELTFGSGRCQSCVPLIVRLALTPADSKGRDCGGGSQSKAAFGLAFVLASLCLSNDELKKEALRERDVSSEEYEHLERIQRMQGPTDGAAGPPAVEEADGPERVEGRIDKVVEFDGVRALAQLAGRPNVGALTEEQAAMAFARIATLPKHRGLMIQQGAYNACLDLGKDGGGSGRPEGVRARALHALAKLLVTTNPAVLSDRQRASAVPNLLWLCRWAKADNLQQFEALMALTNLAAADEACLEAVVAHRGVPCFQSLQYSEHPMVRRAATEVMCNLARHPAAQKHLSDPGKLEIWLALAAAYEDSKGGDLATARAAAGALAIASQDERVARAVVAAGGRAAGGGTAEGGTAGTADVGRAWTALLRSGNADLIHRAAIVVYNVARFGEPRTLLQKDKALKAALSQLVDRNGASPLPPPVQSAVEAAKMELQS